MRVALPTLANRGLVAGSRREELVDLLNTIGREAHPDLVVFPELAVPGYPADTDQQRDVMLLETLSESVIGGPSAVAFQAVARRYGLISVVGISERDGATLYDTLAVIGADGVLGHYRKVHLTSSETTFWAPGTAAVTVPTELGVLGPAVCYDRMFPDGFRLMRERGAELFVISSAWSVWRGDSVVAGDIWSEHGELFDRARAAENGVPLVSANWAGPKRPGSTGSFGGGARVLDGLGRDVERCETHGWGSVWELDLMASSSRVHHVNRGDFFKRDSRSLS